MKTWEKPKLTILVRSKPEEVLLLFCKTETLSGASPTSFDFGCDVATACVACLNIATS